MHIQLFVITLCLLISSCTLRDLTSHYSAYKQQSKSLRPLYSTSKLWQITMLKIFIEMPCVTDDSLGTQDSTR